MSKVDVVIPCYNYGRYLEDCVRSVLDQGGVDVRVLIIDDASPDDTPVVGRRIAEADSRVEFRRHVANRGHIATYNEGLLEWCRHEYSLLLSADDMLAEGALERATSVLDRHIDVDLAYGFANAFTGDVSLAELNDPLQAELSTEEPPYNIVSSEEFLRYCFYSGNPVPTPTALVRTATQQRLGGYLAELPHSGDMEMWMRFALNGPVAFLRSVQAHYRFHSSNMTHSYSTSAIGDRREVLSALRIIAHRAEGRLVGLDRWMNDLRARFVSQALTRASAALDDGDRLQFEVCLNFAEEIEPGSGRTVSGLKVRLKSIVGPKVSARLAAAWKRARPARKDAARSRAESAPNGPTAASQPISGFGRAVSV
jgi:glycosyltransferase involved in cell wall biosynthesis